MARLPRLNIPNIPQHVIQRGNNRTACFFAETDYHLYLAKLQEYSEQFSVQVHAYVLMTNHVHLLLTPSTSHGVSRLMQSLGRFYVQYINKTYQRSGTLWEGRYKSTLVDSDNYFLSVSRYIELNPVRANMVEHPIDYPWSSFRVNALAKASTFINYHPSFEQLGKNAAECCNNYLLLFDKQISTIELDNIRHCTNKNWVLGSDKFKSQIESQLTRRVTPSTRGGDRRSLAFKSQQKNQQL